MLKVVIASSVFALSVPLAGQQDLVVPAGTGATGNAGSIAPVPGAGHDARVQVLVEAAHLSGFVGRSLAGVAFRRDTSLNREFLGGVANIDAFVSPSARTALTLSEQFDQNFDANSRVAAFTGPVTLPTSSSPAGRLTGFGVAQDRVEIVFSTPFVYAGGSLLLDVIGRQQAASPAGAWIADGAVDSVSGTVNAIGNGCGSTKSASVNPRMLQPGSTAGFVVDGAPGSSGVWLIGQRIPAIDLAVIGLPGCELHVAPIASLPTLFRTLATPTGPSFTVSHLPLQVPFDSTALSASLTAQAVALSSTIETSEAIEFTIAGRVSTLGMAMVHASLDGGQSPAVGTVIANRAPVLQLRWQ